MCSNFTIPGAAGLQCTCRSKKNNSKASVFTPGQKQEGRNWFHLCLEVNPMLISLLVVQRQPRVRHIVHQVVPVPHGHRGLRPTTSRRRKHCSTTKLTNSACVGNATIPMCLHSAAPRVSSRCRRSPLLLLQRSCPQEGQNCALLFFFFLFPETQPPRDTSGSLSFPNAARFSSNRGGGCLFPKPQGENPASSPQVMWVFWIPSCWWKRRSRLSPSLPPQSTKRVPHWSEVPKHDATPELGGKPGKQVSPALRIWKCDTLNPGNSRWSDWRGHISAEIKPVKIRKQQLINIWNVSRHASGQVMRLSAHYFITFYFTARFCTLFFF